jgi:hypothetical protein
MDLVFMYGLTGKNMKEIGKMANNMELVMFIYRKQKNLRENGT